MTAPSSPPRLLDGDFYANDPHPQFTWMRQSAPVYWDEVGQVWGIARYEDVLAISREPQTFSNSQGNRPDGPPMPFMIAMDDPLHKRRRNLVNKGFTPRRLLEREPRLRQLSRQLIDRARALGELDFVKDVAAWLPLMVIGDMLGVEPDAYADLLRWSEEMVLGSGTTSEEVIQRANLAFIEYAEYQNRVIADRRAKPPQPDLISILVHADIDGDKLSDDDILWEALLILIGGDETTRHVLTGGMYQLLLHDDQWRELRRAPGKLPMAVEEMLRWVSPIQNMSRVVLRDVEFRGRRMRAGDKLVLLYPSANRDESVFNEPFRFDIARNPNDHLAFGYGAHYCLGASLARLELRVFFHELLERLPELELAPEFVPRYRSSNFITGIEAMPLRVRG